MATRTEVSLLNFMIFNSTFGPKEGEEELKVLYYHPKEAALDTKIKDVGLCEAIIKFTNTFTQNSNEIEVVNTQKTMQLYLQPETEYWMILTVSSPFEKRLKDGAEFNDYHTEELNEAIYKSLLKQFYLSFHLLHGGFEFLALNREGLCEVLSIHFDKYLSSVNLTADIASVWGSVQYLPVNQGLFLKIQSFVNLVEATFEKHIENCVFLYGKQVVWSGLIPENLYVFYEWLQRVVISKLATTGIQGDFVGSFQQSRQYGNFITGPRTLNCMMPTRKMFFKEFGINRSYDLLIYKALNCMICLFVTSEIPSSDSNINFYDEIASIMGPQMVTINTELSDLQSMLIKEKDLSEPTFKFIFFNELTLKHEGTIRSSNIPIEVMNIIADLYGDRKSGGTSEEVIVKTHHDFWIIRKSSNYRHYFLILNKTSSTLIDITREARKITDQHIQGIFFDKQNDLD